MKIYAISPAAVAAAGFDWPVHHYLLGHGTLIVRCPKRTRSPAFREYPFQLMS